MARQRAERLDAALWRRVVSAVVLASPALLALWLGGWLFAALVAVAVVIMADEWARLAPGLDDRGRWLVRLAAALFPLMGMVSVMQGEVEVALLVILLGTVLAAGGVALAGSAGAGRAALGAAYLGLPALALVALRNEPGSGFALVLWLLLVVWATDIAAYFVGRGLGGPKLAPLISPGKTWAGLLGGMAGAGLVGGAVAGPLGGLFWVGAVVGALLAVVAQIGDLFESAVKRRAGVKDSGTLIPGHGGLLDRLDGLLFSAPAYAFLIGPCGVGIVA
jgi:phosphatidate cytidylyltransferase